MTDKSEFREIGGVSVGIAFGALLWLAVFAWLGVWR